MIESLRAEVTALRAQVEDLQAQLRRDSSNSSKPPSSDEPWKAPEARRQPGQRKRGGQPGHKGHKREMVEPDEVVELRPASCTHCGEGLSGDDAAPWRHQVAEVPRVTARITEYRLHALGCASCGDRTRAAWPEGLPRGAFGPRLQAIVAVCSGAYRLSKRNIEALVRDFFGVELSVGSVSRLEASTSDALATPYEDAHTRVRGEAIVHADETGWSQASKLTWLWTAISRSVAFFMIRERRTSEVARELLGKHFKGVLVTDRYHGYHWFSDRRRQLCWAHLIRNFRALLEWPAAKAFGERLLDFSRRLFETWHRVRDGTLRRRDLIEALAPFQRELAQLLVEGQSSPHPRVRGLCKSMARHEASLWTFAARKGVEPTNNAAERALRHAVIWRKTSFGTDSDTGSRFAERILTVVGTLRLQKRHVLEYVTAACSARLSARSAPPLFDPGA